MGQKLSSEEDGSVDLKTLVTELLSQSSSYSRTNTSRSLGAILAAQEMLVSPGGNQSAVETKLRNIASVLPDDHKQTTHAAPTLASTANEASNLNGNGSNSGNNARWSIRSILRVGKSSATLIDESKSGPFLPVSIPTLYLVDSAKDGRIHASEVVKSLKRWNKAKADAKAKYLGMPKWKKALLQENAKLVAIKHDSGVLTLFAVRRVLKDVKSCTVWCDESEQDAAFFIKHRGKDLLAVNWLKRESSLRASKETVDALKEFEKLPMGKRQSSGPAALFGGTELNVGVGLEVLKQQEMLHASENIDRSTLEEYIASVLAADEVIKEDHSALVRLLEYGGKSERRKFTRWLWRLVCSSRHVNKGSSQNGTKSDNAKSSSGDQSNRKSSSTRQPLPPSLSMESTTEGAADLSELCQLLQLLHEDCIDLENLPLMCDSERPNPYSDLSLVEDGERQEIMFRGALDPYQFFESTGLALIRSLRAAHYSSSSAFASSSASTMVFDSKSLQDNLLDMSVHHSNVASALLSGKTGNDSTAKQRISLSFSQNSHARVASTADSRHMDSESREFPSSGAFSDFFRSGDETFSRDLLADTTALKENEIGATEFVALGELILRIYQLRPREKLNEVGWYELRREIGSGAQGMVSVGREISTGNQVAIKSIGRLDHDEPYDGVLGRNPIVTGVLDIMTMLKGHPNIVKYQKVIATSDQVHFILNFCPGGSIFELVMYLATAHDDIEKSFQQWSTPLSRQSMTLSPKRRSIGSRGSLDSPAVRSRFTSSATTPVIDPTFQIASVKEVPLVTENVARKIFRSLVDAIAFCHEREICHRDIRLHNLLLDENGNTVLIDFDSASIASPGWDVFPGENLVGSLFYQAPEQVGGQCYRGKVADVWAMGVVLYWLFHGKPPFVGTDHRQTFAEIARCDLKISPLVPKAVSKLLRQILTKDAAARPTAADILFHPWVQDENVESLVPVLDTFLCRLPAKSLTHSSGSEDVVSNQIRKVWCSIWNDADKFFLLREENSPFAAHPAPVNGVHHTQRFDSEDSSHSKMNSKQSIRTNRDSTHNASSKAPRSLIMQVGLPEFEFSMHVSVWFELDSLEYESASQNVPVSCEQILHTNTALFSSAEAALRSALLSTDSATAAETEDLSPQPSMRQFSLIASASKLQNSNSTNTLSGKSLVVKFERMNGPGAIFVKASRRTMNLFLNRVHQYTDDEDSLWLSVRRSIGMSPRPSLNRSPPASSRPGASSPSDQENSRRPRKVTGWFNDRLKKTSGLHSNPSVRAKSDY